jgi:hypothetical protein
MHSGSHPQVMLDLNSTPHPTLKSTSIVSP